ncbi:hypothetical protein BGZ82_010131 [Podila clonocystis]|nr:hypothetical protein BGZ82_010131 [Podila clonocystis]
MPTITPREQALKQPRPTSATSAIFGPAFERQNQSALGGSPLVLNGSYFMGPRAPQYIPSPMASPVSPNADQLPDVQAPTEEDTPEPKPLKAAASHGSLSAMATELMQDHEQDQLELPTKTIANNTNDTQQFASVSQELEFDDSIKVEVAEHQGSGEAEAEIEKEVIAEDNYKVEVKESTLGQIGGMARSESDESTNTGQPSAGSRPLQLLELSFSTNDLTSLWNPSSKSTSLLDLGSSVESSEKRARSHTFHGLSDLNLGAHISSQNMAQSNSTLSSSISTTISESSSTGSFLGVSKSHATFPPKQSSPLREGHVADVDAGVDSGQEVERDASCQSSKLQAGGPDDSRPNLREQTRGDRKRLSLVTSSMGLAAAAARSMEDVSKDRDPNDKSFIDFPSWELAPLSPPLAVKEISGAPAPEGSSAATSPMNIRRGSTGVRRESLTYDSLMSPASATVMTPTTPLTTREKRILAGREALLRISPDKQRMSRGTSISSTTSSQPSGQGSSGDHDDSETLGSHDASRRTSVRRVGQTGGVFGAVPQRGQMKDHVPEPLVFPDQSIRPIPLKAYKVRKMTLKERNQTYAQAYQEFTKARTGLDTWSLRCMMQDRPALMKDPPAIVKAVAGKFTPGSGGTMNSAQNAFNAQDQRSQTPTSIHSNSTMVGSFGGNSINGGIGARIKNAGKRLSMDISAGMPGNYASHLGISSSDLLASSVGASSPSSGNGTGSVFYKQKTTRSAVELGAGSINRGRAGSGNSSIPPQATPSSSSGHRNSIVGTIGTSTLQRGSMGGPATGSSPAPPGSGFLSHNKRHSLGVGNSSPLSSSLRGRTMSDVPAGSRLFVQRNYTQGSIGRHDPLSPRDHAAPSSDFMNAAPHYGGGAGGGPLSPSPSTSSMGSGSMIIERPIKRSTSNHYTRRPTSMMVLPNGGDGQQKQGQPSISGSNFSLGSKSTSSLGSVSSSSMTDLQKSPSTSLKQQEQNQNQDPASASTAPGLSSYYNADGGLIPYADDITSKEVYSPLTSPIMIPIGGFPEPKRPSNQITSPTNGGWTSPLSAGGLTRPLTYAGQSSYPYGAGSNSSLVMSPSSISRASAGSGAGPAIAGLGVSGEYTMTGSGPVQYSPVQPPQTSGGNYPAASAVQEKPEKTEKSKFGATLNRYSTGASFASIGSFSKNKGSAHKRLSKKEKKREEEQQQLQPQQKQQQQQQQQQDQRFSVASHSVAPTNDFLVEQSLDKLSDVLPHVDRDRLAIYLQRAYGDEMVAIGLAMSDLRTGML